MSKDKENYNKYSEQKQTTQFGVVFNAKRYMTFIIKMHKNSIDLKSNSPIERQGKW